MEQPQRDHLAGPEVRLGVLGHGAQLLIDVVEQGGDKLYGGRDCSGSPFLILKKSAFSGWLVKE